MTNCYTFTSSPETGPNSSINTWWEAFFGVPFQLIREKQECKETVSEELIEVTPVNGYHNLPIFVEKVEQSEENFQDGIKTHVPPYKTKFYTSLALIKDFPEYILAILTPTQEMWDVAIKEDSRLCSYIGQPTKEQIVSAVKQDIHFLKNLDKKLLTDEIMELAVIVDGHAIQYAPKQTKKLQELALKSNPLSIQFMKDATAEMKLQAVKANSRAIEFI